MEIENLTKDIRQRSFDRKKDKTPDQVAASWYNDDLTYDGVKKTLFLILPTPGCSWALGDAGGCTMCSYVSDCTLEAIDSNDIIRIFNEHLERFPLDEEDEIAVKLFASGSFLNPHELPKDARDEILKTLVEMGNVKEIIVESRPEYVNETFLDEIADIIGDTLFEVSIGLETSNDETRLNKINKGFTAKDFEEAVNLIHKLRDEKNYNFKAKAYVFVKPIFLSEKEAIDEAIATAEYCDGIDVDRLSFCPATIHGGTLIERLWRQGAYQPPWIWSAVEIINTVRENMDIPALLDTSGFGSRRGPYNCKKCNKELKHLIIDSNLNQSIIEYDCECKDSWLADVNNSNMNFSKTFNKHIPLY
ncbi:MAG: archaeosine biosynthesis radical SAM protein RaSEA [Methanobrevibacter sp.]|uniref:archaeosine biosynthesis radical SAM protein RaSEA n=1 Tax=Methanobrevibacter sp. TaxID=66852 RepID=UPI0026E0BDE4|nr:archaeosine biosynthesis radical SAM protein RaSEA [Methanobrevibacter sp.]MDO5848376.1 archaeosine biosynthesis radical SAM protein RaSEA [Methanobrevibacter sp.]